MTKRFAGFTPDQQHVLLSKMGYSGPNRQDMMDAFVQATPGVAAKMGRFHEKAVSMAEGGEVSKPKPNKNGTYTNKVTGTKWKPTKNGTRYMDDDDPTARKKGFQVGDVWKNPATGERKLWNGDTWKLPGMVDSADMPVIGDTFVNSDGVTVEYRRNKEGQMGWVQQGATGEHVSEDPDEATDGWTQYDVGSLSLEQITKRAGKLNDRFAAAKLAAEKNPEDPTAQAELNRVTKKLQGLNAAMDVYKQGQVGDLTDKAINDPKSLVTSADKTKINKSDKQFMTNKDGRMDKKVTAKPVDVAPTEIADVYSATASQAEAASAEAVTAGAPTLANMPADVKPASYEAALIGQQQVREILNQELRDPITGEPSEKATVQGQMKSLMSQFEGGGTPPWASGAMREAMSIMASRGMDSSSMAGQAVTQAALEAAIAVASQDANINAEFEMANLDRMQQDRIFRTQSRINVMLSDQAAENAARQFNAASRNEINTFMAGLEADISKFNTSAINNMRQFNAAQRQQANLTNAQMRNQTNIVNAQLATQVDQFNAELASVTDRFNAGEANEMARFKAQEKNAMRQFNADLKHDRAKFNATNRSIVAQANTQWRRDLAQGNSSMKHETAMLDAKSATGMTQAALDNLWQHERDLMHYAFTATMGQLDRDLSLLLADKQINAAQRKSDREALGFLFGTALRSVPILGDLF